MSVFPETITSTKVIETTIIRELCEARAASEEWSDPTGRFVENLCDVCYRIRRKSDKFDKIARWEEKEPNAQLAWIKLSLNYEWVSFYIRLLFEEFVEQLVAASAKPSIAIAEEINTNLRPIVLLADFTQDYQAFLASFYDALLEAGFSKERIQVISTDFKDLYVIKLRRGAEALNIVDIFSGLLLDFFPRCQKDSPVRLSMGIAPIKFPFFNHWRYFQQPKDIINIQMPGKAKLEIDLTKLADLKTIDLTKRRVSSFLHRLADIEARTGSRILTQAELLEARKRFPKLVDLYTSGRLDADEILSYYKIARG
jgi:hypothetical protein